LYLAVLSPATRQNAHAHPLQASASYLWPWHKTAQTLQARIPLRAQTGLPLLQQGAGYYYRQGLHHPLSLTLAHATPRGPADQAEAAVAAQIASVENPVKTRI